MHQPSTLHSSVQLIALTSKANFLFSAKTLLISFLRQPFTVSRAKNTLAKIQIDREKLVCHPACPDNDRQLAYPERSRREGSQRRFKQYKSEQTEDTPVNFSKWCNMVHAEDGLADAPHGGVNLSLSKTPQLGQNASSNNYYQF